MRRASIILVILAAVLMLPVTLYDPVDQETAKFRAGAPTEEVLAARETSVPPNPYGWLWKPALACAVLGSVGLLLSRRRNG